MSKTGIDFFNKDSAYKILKDIVNKDYGNEVAISVWKTAGENLNALLKKYKDVPKGEKWHLYKVILPRVAMYQAMSEKIDKNNAIKIMDETVKITGTKVGNLLGKITALPGMSNIFLKLFKFIEKKLFGNENGFIQEFYETNDKTLRFDIKQCPYCKYSIECNCPEIIHTFCDSDIYCYGNLPNIEFNRTKTLGTGGDCCDFYLKRKR